MNMVMIMIRMIPIPISQSELTQVKLVRRRNNKNNDNHILTLNERFFYQRLAIDGTQRIIDECWKIVNNPAEQDQERKSTALHIALEGQVQLCDMRLLVLLTIMIMDVNLIAI